MVNKRFTIACISFLACLHGKLCLALRTSDSEDCAANAHFAGSHGDGALKVLAHAHAQLELLLALQTELLDHQVPLLLEANKVLVLILGRGLLAARNGANGHETQKVEVGALFNDELAQGHGVGAGRAPRLGLLARRVDLDVNVELGHGRRRVGRRDELAAVLVQELRLLGGVHARHAEEVGNLGQALAVT